MRNRLATRPVAQMAVDLFGPLSGTLGSQIDAAQTTYQFSTAVTASTYLMPGGFQPARVNQLAPIVYAHWQVVWTPNAIGCGIELVDFAGGPTDILQMAEITNDAATTPVAGDRVITTRVQTIWTSSDRYIGWRAKGNGTVGPFIRMSRLHFFYET